MLESIHHQIIHFPIALLSTGFLSDLWGAFKKQPNYFAYGRFLNILGSIGAIVAVFTGFIADRLYGHMATPFPILKSHGSIQLIVSAVLIVLTYWRMKKNPTEKLPKWYMISFTFVIIFMLYVAHLGGKMAGHF